MTLDDYKKHLERGITQQQQALETLSSALEQKDWHTAWIEAEKIAASANWCFVEAKLTSGRCSMLIKARACGEVIE